jgi:hypothetical protein
MNGDKTGVCGMTEEGCLYDILDLMQRWITENMTMRLSNEALHQVFWTLGDLQTGLPSGVPLL